ncbi:MAG: hypothetical protein V4500_08065 [Pseudomonadota bacterium]
MENDAEKVGAGDTPQSFESASGKSPWGTTFRRCGAAKDSPLLRRFPF